MPSVFMRILQGELPCYEISQNEWVFSFLALDQVQRGHVLVIPKIEIDQHLDLPEPHYSALFQEARRLGLAQRKALSCPRVSALFLGFEVPHVHYHLIPSWKESDVNFGAAIRYPKEEMVAIQQTLQKHLEGP